MLRYSNPYTSLKKYEESIVIPCSQTREISILACSYNDSAIMFDGRFNNSELIDREMFIEYEVTVKFTTPAQGANPMNPILDYSEFTLSQNPIHRVMKKCKINLNSSCVLECDNSIIRNPLSHYEDMENMTSSLEIPDVVNNLFGQSRVEFYDIANNNAVAIADWKANNMIGDSHFRNSPYQRAEERHRGHYRPVEITIANTNQVTLRYHIIERLSHPYLNDKKYSTLANINNFTVNLEFNSLQPMFQTAIVVGNLVNAYEYEAPTNFSISFNGYQPKLLTRIYVPIIKVNPVINVPYSNYNVLKFSSENYGKNITQPANLNITAGDSAIISTPNICLSSVPHKMYLFIAPTSNYTDYFSADSYCSITNVKMVTQKDQSLFSQSSQYQLYQLGKRNGLNRNWEQFSNWTGSVLCLDLEKSDISHYIAGSLEPFNFELSVSFTNTCYDYYRNGIRTGTFFTPKRWSLYVVIENKGKLILGNVCAMEYGLSQSYIANFLQKS
jgi:hypothetical protein